MKTADDDVGKYLSMFTLLNKDQIVDIMNEHRVRNAKINCINIKRMREIDQAYIMLIWCKTRKHLKNEKRNKY